MAALCAADARLGGESNCKRNSPMTALFKPPGQAIPLAASRARYPLSSVSRHRRTIRLRRRQTVGRFSSQRPVRAPTLVRIHPSPTPSTTRRQAKPTVATLSWPNSCRLPCSLRARRSSSRVNLLRSRNCHRVRQVDLAPERYFREDLTKNSQTRSRAYIVEPRQPKNRGPTNITTSMLFLKAKVVTTVPAIMRPHVKPAT